MLFNDSTISFIFVKRTKKSMTNIDGFYLHTYHKKESEFNSNLLDRVFLTGQVLSKASENESSSSHEKKIEELTTWG